MVAKRTTEAYEALLARLNSAKPSMAPRLLQAQLLADGFSRTDIQRAIQLALSNGSIKLDGALKFEAAELQAA